MLFFSLTLVFFFFQLEDAVILVEQMRRKNMKYQADEIRYQARIDPERLSHHERGVPIAAIVGSVRALFDILIRRATEGLAPSDLIRLCIQVEGLDKPISTTLMRVEDLTTEKVMTSVMKVLQSKDDIQLDKGFSVDVMTIRRPVVCTGRTDRRKLSDIGLDKIKKQSILSIP
jgi:hypothetical protein